MLEQYSEFSRDDLAMHVISGVKSESEKSLILYKQLDEAFVKNTDGGLTK